MGSHNIGGDLKTVFESDRIAFVEVSEKLVADYLVMVNDEERVGRFISAKKHEPYTEEQEVAWVRGKLAEGACVFSMIEKESGDFIGNIEFMDVTDGVGELGIALTAAKQDNGYGSEAIPAFLEYGKGKLGLKKSRLRARPSNARALHVYEKCGFREYDRSENDVFMETDLL